MTESAAFDPEATAAWAQKVLAGLDDKPMNFFEMGEKHIGQKRIYSPEDEEALAEAGKVAEESEAAGEEPEA